MTTARAESAPAAGGTHNGDGVLDVHGLKVHYGGVRAVHDVSFRVGAGEAVGIIGTNGAGKTSVLKAVLGLVKRSAHQLRYGEHDLLTTSPHRIVRAGIGYVPEGRHVFGGLSVEKNLLLGGYSRRWDGATREKMAEIFELFPVLSEMRHRLAGALSGGQQQMLAIGRGLMSDPKLLVLDEPSMGLSPFLVDFICEVLQRLSRSGLSLLVVEQNAKLTFEVTTFCFVMENGKIAMAGPADELRTDPAIRRIYLGI
jgi:branched-chain amino acid transport system ATP-binding protein